MNIFIHKNGQQSGPYTIDDVNSKALNGELYSTDAAWIEGWGEWQTLSCLPGFISKPVPPPFKPPVFRPPIPPSPPAESQMRVGPIIRDIVIVCLLSAIGGFVVGFATGPEQDPQRYILALGASNLLLGTIAFTIVGCLAPPKRWHHLGIVAIGAWLIGFINVVFFHVSIFQWMSGAIFIAIMMGIGGGVSYLFGRKTNLLKPRARTPSAIPSSSPLSSQVGQTVKAGGAPPVIPRSLTATVGTYIAGLVLLVIGFLSQEGANTYDLPRGISAEVAGTIGGACPALLVLFGFLAWRRWFRGHRGSIIMLVGLVGAVKGVGALIAGLMMISYVTLTFSGAMSATAVEPRSISSQPSMATETEKDQEFQRQRAKSKSEAMALYPDVADHNTRLGREVDRLIESYKSTDDQILYAPDAPMLITKVAAKNLGLASREK